LPAFQRRKLNAEMSEMAMGKSRNTELARVSRDQGESCRSPAGVVVTPPHVVPPKQCRRHIISLMY
jgi:hypothetical protein